jgi:transcriptional regulator with XRE-family HTH domain
MNRWHTDAVSAATEVLAAGGSLAQAAEEVGVTRRTLERWRAQGRAELDQASSLARLALEADRPAGVAARPLSEAELVELLEAQARRGSVRAIQLVLARRANAPAERPRTDDPFWEVDQLAAQRRRPVTPALANSNPVA